MTTTNEKLWCIHIPGPDDLYSAPSHEMAEHMAACHNAAMKEFFDRNPEKLTQWGVTFDEIKARVIEWTHGADEHAEDLSEFDPEEWALDEPAAIQKDTPMTTTPQAALLREAAQIALITLDGISNANPRDKADFETPSEWIAWAKSRARFAADALREPISREVYAERILKQMLREASEPQTEKKCGTCGFIGQEDPVKGCPKCGFDDMRDKLQATQAEPVQAGELPDEREAFEREMCAQHGLTPVYFRRNENGYQNAATESAWTGWQARAALAARKPLTGLTREQMEAGRHQVFSTNNPFCPCDSKTFRKVSEWTEREFCRINGLEVKP